MAAGCQKLYQLCSWKKKSHLMHLFGMEKKRIGNARNSISSRGRRKKKTTTKWP